MAKKSSAYFKSLRFESLFSKRRNLWINKSNQKILCLNPTNIAEGCGRNSNAELKYFLTVATGSCSELEYQLLLSKDLNYMDSITYNELSEKVIELRKMIFSFIRKLPLK